MLCAWRLLVQGIFRPLAVPTEAEEEDITTAEVAAVEDTMLQGPTEAEGGTSGELNCAICL